MAPPTVGKQVFLRVTTATTTVMRGMTSEDTTGQKAADGRKKSPATPVKKQTLTILAKGKKKIGKGLPMQPSRQDGATWGRRERTYTKATVFVPATAGLFLPPKADFLYLRIFSLPTGRRGWGWRRMSESVLSTTLPTATNAKGAALKSRKSFCIYIKLIMHTTTAGDTSSPLWMVRTLDNSVGVAAACGLLVCSCFCTGDSRTFSTAKGGLFVFADFQPADRQARMGMAANVRERALDDIADSHKRKGRSPEKPQIFLYLYHADYAYNNRQRHFFLAF